MYLMDPSNSDLSGFLQQVRQNKMNSTALNSRCAKISPLSDISEIKFDDDEHASNLVAGIEFEVNVQVVIQLEKIIRLRD